ncbi:MAG TPA: AraC family transcriptional regulator [Clostridia bacterium]|nr:AraC family transcriptional regulator [Clostridia bacterium]
MIIDLNNLIARFAQGAFKVQGVYRYTIEPGTISWQKTAPFPGFIFPLGGQAKLNFNNTPYQADVENVLHGGANMSLEKCVVGNRNWEYISILYDIHESASKELYMPDMHFELAVGKSPRLIDMLYRLWNISNRPGALSTFQTETLFRCVLEETFICSLNHINSNTQTLFEQVSTYIQARYMDALTVRGLAEQSKVNENQLYYAFRKNVEMGPGDYLMVYRLNRAKALLITGDAPIGEVSKSVGYSDALYFSRAFRKQFGVSPSALRRNFRNNP